jgi:Fe-S-cluster containining protein
MTTLKEFVEELYRWVDAQVSAGGSVCGNCQACCDFDGYGHRLYVTNVEAAYFQQTVAAVRRPVGRVCPYLRVGVGCEARGARPIGCRTFFCRPGADYDMIAVTEEALARIKRFVESQGASAEYRYQDWIAALNDLADAKKVSE